MASWWASSSPTVAVLVADLAGWRAVGSVVTLTTANRVFRTRALITLFLFSHYSSFTLFLFASFGALVEWNGTATERGTVVVVHNTDLTRTSWVRTQPGRKHGPAVKFSRTTGIQNERNY